MFLSEVNSKSDRLALIEADISWWLHFFAPAVSALQHKNDEDFYKAYNRYQEVCGFTTERE